jgi:hypothetical protein
VVTLDPDGTPHITLAWAGFDIDELVMATFLQPGAAEAREPSSRPSRRPFVPREGVRRSGLWPYAVIQGRVDRIAEGGALEVMDRLAEFYLGPGQRYPLRDAPEGVVIHVSVERIYGQGI